MSNDSKKNPTLTKAEELILNKLENLEQQLPKPKKKGAGYYKRFSAWLRRNPDSVIAAILFYWMGHHAVLSIIFGWLAKLFAGDAPDKQG